MMKMKLNKEFWKEKYLLEETPWDAGSATTPITTFIDGLTNKNLRILIPGAGNGHEFEYLYHNGFKNVYALDITEEPLNNIKKRVPELPEKHLILQDFFELKDSFDLILEQTFFCALAPDLRPLYAKKTNEILSQKGQLAGVLFDFPLTESGPPFGGDTSEYIRLFEPFFEIKTLEPCYNSIKPRKDKELFIHFYKK